MIVIQVNLCNFIETQIVLKYIIYSGTCLGDHSTVPRKSGRRRQVVAGDR